MCVKEGSKLKDPIRDSVKETWTEFKFVNLPKVYLSSLPDNPVIW